MKIYTLLYNSLLLYLLLTLFQCGHSYLLKRFLKIRKVFSIFTCIFTVFGNLLILLKTWDFMLLFVRNIDLYSFLGRMCGEIHIQATVSTFVPCKPGKYSLEQLTKKANLDIFLNQKSMMACDMASDLLKWLDFANKGLWNLILSNNRSVEWFYYFSCKF